jgi:hypothetical protein
METNVMNVVFCHVATRVQNNGQELDRHDCRPERARRQSPCSKRVVFVSKVGASLDELGERPLVVRLTTVTLARHAKCRLKVEPPKVSTEKAVRALAMHRLKVVASKNVDCKSAAHISEVCNMSTESSGL